MKLIKQWNADVSAVFSPNDCWLKKSDDEYKGEYMLCHRIDMSYCGKSDQEGSPVLYLSDEEAQVFREAGFDELL